MSVESAREVFETHMPHRFQDKPDSISGIKASYKFVLSGDNGGTWVVDLTGAAPTIREEDTAAQCTITMAAKDLVSVVNGSMNPQMAFMTGKLKVAGDMGLALKLSNILS